MYAFRFFSLLGLYAFLMVYLVDPALYPVQVLTGVPVPIGMLGLSLGVMLFFALPVERFRGAAWMQLFLLLGFCIFFTLIAFFSPFRTPLDLWEIGKYLSVFSIGAWLGCYLLTMSEVRRTQLGIIILISTALASLLVGGIIHHLQWPDKYLRVADALAVTSLIGLGLCWGRYTLSAHAVFWICMAGLVLIGSRGALIGVFAGYILFLAAGYRFRVLMTFVAGALLFYLLLPAIVSLPDYDGPGARLLRLAYTPDQDTSLQSRLELADKGMSACRGFLCGTGNFGYHRELVQGGYVHDARSYIIEFGIAGGAWLLILTFFFVAAIARAVKTLPTWYSAFFISLSGYVILNMIFIRHLSYITPYFAAGLGFTVLSGWIRKSTQLKNR